MDHRRVKKMMFAMIVSSLIMIISIFALDYRILGIGLLQWVIVLILAFRETPMIKQFSFDEFAEYNESVTIESWKSRKFFKSAVYATVTPMMMCGVLFVIVAITTLIMFG